MIKIKTEFKKLKTLNNFKFDLINSYNLTDLIDLIIKKSQNHLKNIKNIKVLLFELNELIENTNFTDKKPLKNENKTKSIKNDIQNSICKLITEKDVFECLLAEKLIFIICKNKEYFKQTKENFICLVKTAQNIKTIENQIFEPLKYLLEISVNLGIFVAKNIQNNSELKEFISN